MKMLVPNETVLSGTWQLVGGTMVADHTCERIDWLERNALEKIAISKQFGAWEVLYRDKVDGRLWEKNFPQGELHGGGPPTLQCISEEVARSKFEIGKTNL